MESNPHVVKQLKENVKLLEASRELTVEQANAVRFLQQQTQAFDIIFADPPFDDQILQDTCAAIANSKACSDQTLLYLESARSPAPLPIPASWHIIRQKTVGRVLSTLINTSKS